MATWSDGNGTAGNADGLGSLRMKKVQNILDESSRRILASVEEQIEAAQKELLYQFQAQMSEQMEELKELESEKPQLVSGRSSTYSMVSTPDDGSKPRSSSKRSKNRHSKNFKKEIDKGGFFSNSDKMKEKVREAITKKPYSVFDFYWDKGIAQRIAKSSLFDNLTLSIIAFNAIWIAIDIDNNDANVLIEALPVFQVAEQGFCFFFTFEWVVRFCSFRRKMNCLRDGWFVFDTLLVMLMILETWVLTLVMLFFVQSGGGTGIGNTSALKVFRLLRLSRMARMARLLRAVPELIILIRAIVVATRSVFFTLMLLVIIIYFFAIIFRQVAGDTIETYFPSVTEAMLSLLLDGILPDNAQLMRDCFADSIVMSFMILLFILLAALTVMNMLVGILCEVVSVVAATEKEQLTVTYVKSELLNILEELGVDDDESSCITKAEFSYLVTRPDAAKIIQEIGVDVVGMVDFIEYIFKDGELSFGDFMELMLALRGTNTSTVKDVVDLRRYIASEFRTLANICQSVENMEKNFTSNKLAMEAAAALAAPGSPKRSLPAPPACGDVQMPGAMPAYLTPPPDMLMGGEAYYDPGMSLDMVRGQPRSPVNRPPSAGGRPGSRGAVAPWGGGLTPPGSAHGARRPRSGAHVRVRRHMDTSPHNGNGNGNGNNSSRSRRPNVVWGDDELDGTGY
eukprot:TRINITY_DN17692_c0_g1_i1.p1 TRINITY_DN17692_c0_g1~~TRINITY_DN17692_c0_g1_i1.p1  ORF type:complete len:682 (-),score=147.39 TRINITY_DN17692_c0_g1_i1:120-2165(-)